jgi:hypothetical protein
MTPHRITTILLAATMAALLCGSASAKPNHHAHKARNEHQAALQWLQETTWQYKQETWQTQKILGLHPTRASTQPLGPSVAYRKWVRNLWKHRAAVMKLKLRHPPHLSQWLCLFRYEQQPDQGWATNISNGYYGGLQMDISFQRHYGAWLYASKGTADHWTEWEQMWTAERAFATGRGFGPWPNTRLSCGI